MNVKIKKWGNSLAVRIPKSFAQEVELTSESTVDLAVQKGKLVIDPKPKAKYSLQDLLEGVTKENLHGETDWGEPVGREEW